MFQGSSNIVSISILIMTVVTAAVVNWLVGSGPWVPVGLIPLVLGTLLAASPRQVNEWERGILLRFGRFQSVLQPGISWIVPGVDQVASSVDMRIRSTSFSAEKTLTRDTVPVDVDAVLFWVVTDAKRSVLEVEDYTTTVRWAAQTTLRDVIGQSDLARMISDRQSLDKELQTILDVKSSDWGITVQSVEIRDVRIPHELEDAMSRTAQADREKEARVILAKAETLVAQEMENAAKLYQDNPVALQLRAMNITYESIKEKGALMVIPSGMADSVNPGVMGLASLAKLDAFNSDRAKERT